MIGINYYHPDYINNGFYFTLYLDNQNAYMDIKKSHKLVKLQTNEKYTFWLIELAKKGWKNAMDNHSYV